MSIEQIKANIDRLERELFLHSLQTVETIKLEQLLEEVCHMKVTFLESSFEGCLVVELEDIRFRLLEISYSIKISLNERLGKSIASDEESLLMLYRTA